jgi:integrase/recombinase XerD
VNAQVRQPHQYSGVLQSRFRNELNDFRAWLDARDYNQRTIRQHLLRLDRVLSEMGREPGATCTAARLRDAFARHHAYPAQLANFRSTEHRYRAFLASQGRLLVKAPTDRFSGLCARYRRELVEVRGFSTSTLNHHGATVADFLRRALRPGGQLRDLTRGDIERYMMLKSKENTRQSLQHIVAILRSFLRFCHDQGEVDGGLDCIDTPRTYRGELLPRALAWSDIQGLLRSIDRNHCTGERDYAIVHLMAHYGLRPSEIVTVRLDSIDWQRRTLRVH